ncbi:hypothetical protein [Marinimicrobium sp. ABcell2]|uniref:hypothetical protein n=1 Tax=Marinimicrobium sp. ABcell2 TaxID=3069751 RepID=UPI0027B2123B|nr:hypothetical protein [Marinimicrobium sp. ABcell2]MDQ2075654.1 hypothetical protein [Marinimicrobium sp. ABcell2]
MKKFCEKTKWAILVTLTWAVVGCTGGSVAAGAEERERHAHDTHEHSGGAGKPVAHVELADLEPVELKPGEAQALTVTLQSAYTQGEMVVQVAGANSLEVLGGPQEFTFELSAGGEYHLPVELYAPSPGRHYLNLAVQVNSPEAQVEFRALAVIVNAGDAAMAQPHMEPPVTTSSSGEKIHSLPARERVDEP